PHPSSPPFPYTTLFRSYCLHKTFEAEVRLGTLIVVNTLVGHTVGGGFIQVTGSPVGARASSAIGEPVPAMTIDALLDAAVIPKRSEEHTSELQSRGHLV